jgi:hypothetical protein
MVVPTATGMQWFTINRVAVEKLFSWNFSSEIRFVSYPMKKDVKEKSFSPPL